VKEINGRVATVWLFGIAWRQIDCDSSLGRVSGEIALE